MNLLTARQRAPRQRLEVNRHPSSKLAVAVPADSGIHDRAASVGLRPAAALGSWRKRLSPCTPSIPRLPTPLSPRTRHHEYRGTGVAGGGCCRLPSVLTAGYRSLGSSQRALHSARSISACRRTQRSSSSVVRLRKEHRYPGRPAVNARRGTSVSTHLSSQRTVHR